MKPKPYEKFVVIKKYSDGRVKHFVIYRNKNETNTDVLRKIQQGLKRRKMRNIGEFIICALYKDFMYIKGFFKIPQEEGLWWLDGDSIYGLSFSVFRIINKEIERWIKYDK